MFMRTSPSTRSGKMSCSEQEGRCSTGRGDAPRAAPHQHRCPPHRHCTRLTWPCPGRDGRPVARLPGHHGHGTAFPAPPIPPRAFAAAQPAQGCQLLLFPMPWADSRYGQLRASPSQPQAHRKLGQHVGSCPNTDPDHVLEPGKRRGAYGRTVGSSTGSLGHPSTRSMGHKKTGRVPA